MQLPIGFYHHNKDGSYIPGYSEHVSSLDLEEMLAKFGHLTLELRFSKLFWFVIVVYFMLALCCTTILFLCSFLELLIIIQKKKINK